MTIINKEINIDKQLINSDAMSDHLFETYKKFTNNMDRKNGGQRANIDIDLIMTEVKLVETYGRQIMLKINAGNMAVKAIKKLAKEDIKKLK